MNREADVLIVGSGAVGVCAAYYASKQGLKVVLVDKGEVSRPFAISKIEILVGFLEVNA